MNNDVTLPVTIRATQIRLSTKYKLKSAENKL